MNKYKIIFIFVASLIIPSCGGNSGASPNNPIHATKITNHDIKSIPDLSIHHLEKDDNFSIITQSLLRHERLELYFNIRYSIRKLLKDNYWKSFSSIDEKFKWIDKHVMRIKVNALKEVYK